MRCLSRAGPPLAWSAWGESPGRRSLLKAILNMRCKMPFYFLFFLIPQTAIDWNIVFSGCMLPALTLSRSPLLHPEGLAVVLSGGWRPLGTSNGFLKASHFPIAVHPIVRLLRGSAFQTKLSAVPTNLCSFRNLCMDWDSLVV